MDDLRCDGAATIGEQLRYEHRVRRPVPRRGLELRTWMFENGAAVFAVM